MSGDIEYLKLRRQKRSARHAIETAIRSGKVARGACEVCGVSDVHAHHDDYGSPLIVRWLCQAHHTEIHRQDNLTGQIARLHKAGFGLNEIASKLSAKRDSVRRILARLKFN